jgi:hypothetical protein
MALGTSLFLIAVGAILRFAVSDSVEAIDLPTIGLILMIVVAGWWRSAASWIGATPTATRTPDRAGPAPATVATVRGRDRGPRRR